MNKKLYTVTTKMPLASKLQTCYVVAENTDQAYQKVRDFLDKKDVGFKKERALESVSVIAEAYEFTDYSILFL